MWLPAIVSSAGLFHKDAGLLVLAEAFSGYRPTAVSGIH